jgi:hypothetical protein
VWRAGPYAATTGLAFKMTGVPCHLTQLMAQIKAAFHCCGPLNSSLLVICYIQALH